MELSVLLLIVGCSLFEAAVIVEGPTNNSTESHNGGAVSFGGKCQSDWECQLTDPSTRCRKSSPKHVFIGVCLCKTGYEFTDNDACELVGRRDSVEPTAHISDSSEDGMLSTQGPWRLALTQSPPLKWSGRTVFIATMAVFVGIAIVVIVVIITKRKDISPERRKRKWILQHIAVVPNPDSKY